MVLCFFVVFLFVFLFVARQSGRSSGHRSGPVVSAAAVTPMTLSAVVPRTEVCVLFFLDCCLDFYTLFTDI